MMKYRDEEIAIKNRGEHPRRRERTCTRYPKAVTCSSLCARPQTTPKHCLTSKLAIAFSSDPSLSIHLDKGAQLMATMAAPGQPSPIVTPLPARTPLPLSASQEQQVRDIYHKRVRAKCAEEIRGMLIHSHTSAFLLLHHRL